MDEDRLGMLALSSQASDGPLVASHVLAAVLLLEALRAEVHHTVAPTQVGVTCGCLHLEETMCSSKGKILAAISVQCRGLFRSILKP